jgi:hypothetical protein
VGGGGRGLIPRNEKISTSCDETNRGEDILHPSASSASGKRDALASSSVP